MKRQNRDININKPYFCILPWVHAQVKPDGQIKPCCRFAHRDEHYQTETGYVFDDFNINKDSTLKDAIDSSLWTDIRNKMLNDEQIPGCWKCYREESSGDGRSMRTGANDFWFQHLLEAEDTTLKYIELTLGSFCNLKCRTCSGYLSTTWLPEENILSDHYEDRSFIKTPKQVEKEYQKSDFEDVDLIKFTGGEPMLHPKFESLLDTIISTDRSSDIVLDIFTNASWVPKDKTLSKLKTFKRVNINLSIDGLGSVNDYVRSPSEWSTVEHVTKIWLSQPDSFEVVWHPTFCIYNICQSVEMIEWWINIQQEVKQRDLWNSITTIAKRPPRKNEIRTLPTTYKKLTMVSNVVHAPSYLQCSLLPQKESVITQLKAFQNKMISKLEEGFELDSYDYYALTAHINMFIDKIVNAIQKETSDDQINLFGSYTADLDKLRSENFKTAIPDLYNQFDQSIFKGKINE